MAEKFAVEVFADHPGVSFDLKLNGVQHVVRMNGGVWELLNDGGIRHLTRGTAHWTVALRLAIEMIEKPQ
jgi:hypothetical protein